MKKSFPTLLSFLFLFTGINAQFLSTNGTAIVNETGDTIILRGMGLGGWMLQEGYMLQTADFASAQFQIKNKITELIGTDATEEFYDAWLKNHVTRTDIDSLAAWGFNSVRLPMHYNLYTLPIDEEPVSGEHTWLNRGFEMTDSLIEWCKANEMYVILDLHGAPGGQGNDIAISDRDPSKPSLWQSQKNRDKAVALWRHLAERYKDEPWVGGYDLLNEPNWDLPGGQALRKFYGDITDTIRAVDQRHILFIEGNWFANDFTGLTPPWDDNMVYAPHKYWSYNEQADIKFATDLQRFNIPLYFGESGENSNAWFRDAIELFEDNGIGWAWWPEKKVESIAGLMSIVKTPEYESLLDFWKNGGTTPNANFAKATLLELAENLKLENCKLQKDVVDAMIRQPHSDTSKPFKKHSVPGKIHAVDYDMGAPGIAYHDLGVATYHVSTGSFTAWNNGWAYRNDGVDIEPTMDSENTVGYNVGWIDETEWMQYEITVDEPGIYDIIVRVASDASNGKFHFEMDGSAVTDVQTVSQTGGWQTWKNITISNVIFAAADKKLRYVADGPNINLSSFEFVRTGDISDAATTYISALTADETTVQLNLNKRMMPTTSDFKTNFEITVNGTPATITDGVLNPDNSRTLLFSVDTEFKSTDIIKISYSGAGLTAEDGTPLQVFSLVDVFNNIAEVIKIPGRMEAEAFYDQSGIQLEACSDTGGGENIAYLQPGDYLEYFVDVDRSALYNVTYRTASQSNGGGVRLVSVGDNGNESTLHNATFSPTGGWQNWETSRSFHTVLQEGKQTLKIIITGSEFNVNWLEFDFVTNVEEASKSGAFSVFPNPSDGVYFIDNRKNFNIEKIEVFDILGQLIFSDKEENNAAFAEKIDLSNVADGAYFLKISTKTGEQFSQRILKQ